ncbi:MAG: hypothetical protein B7Z55_11470 [Planctomycetales bacterium 12-60-4]|nr:MAG: hypothetical protein B7Z55_11470 [Planctomycetales bacterium 12-60-4]
MVVDWFRSLLLTFGPIGLIGLSYVVAAPTPVEWDSVWDGIAATSGSFPPQLSESPPEAYRREASRIQARLPDSWVVINHYPFLLTGNLAERDLQRALVDVVLPTSRALAIDYFDHPPAEPITLIVMKDDSSYADALGRLGHSGREEYAGIYVRRSRRLILNLSTGDGTIAHELTHALAHADFPRMPEWFDEGLASLHEESIFSVDGRRLIGQPNWRDSLLREALQREKPPEIGQLVTGNFGRHEPAVDYALARNLCLYLQSQNLLGPYYRKCRARIFDDPTGRWSLMEITGSKDLSEVDERFRRWFLGRPITHQAFHDNYRGLRY